MRLDFKRRIANVQYSIRYSLVLLVMLHGGPSTFSDWGHEWQIGCLRTQLLSSANPIL